MSVRSVSVGFLDVRRLWSRLAAGFGVTALCLNLLVPLVLVATLPIDTDVLCSAATPGGSDGPRVPAAPCHCPLCLVLAGGAMAPPAAFPVAAPPPPVFTQPHRLAPTLPPAAVRLIAPYPRAPPAV